MDLTGLKWCKNVNHQGTDKYWAYNDNFTSRMFLLNWRSVYKENAHKPKEGELILLRQHAKITHIVKLLNHVIYADGSDSEFNIGRLVQVVWITNNWDNLPSNEDIFGCPVIFPPNGKVISLENKEDFEQHWHISKNGWLEFQNHVQEKLNRFDGNWYQPLIHLG
ncbi:hypothetical protein GS682_28040 [Nostoc sp. B(2019)]|nr:hypothetical protein [Nostoc sp. B(2019)]